MMRQRFGSRFYIVNFQESDEADRRLAADPRLFLERIMRRASLSRRHFEALPPERQVISLLDLLERDEPPGEPLLSDEELDVYVRTFAAGGFTGPINWYRNFSNNWRATAGVEQAVRMPALFIGASDDIVIQPRQVEAMKSHVPDLEVTVMPDTGHWIQQERPDRTNSLLTDWLGRRFPP